MEQLFPYLSKVHRGKIDLISQSKQTEIVNSLMCI